MMTESVTVTVQDPSRTPAGANNPQAANKQEPGRTSLFAGLTVNLLYFKTIPGLIKVAQLILGIICMACGTPGWSGAGHWFLIVSVTAFIMSLIWTIIYLFSVREVLKIPVNWIATELLNTAIYALLYFTAFVAQLATAIWPPHIVSGVFGIFNTIAYAAGAYFLYLEYKNGQ